MDETTNPHRLTWVAQPMGPKQPPGHSVELKVVCFAQEYANQPGPSGKQVRTK